MITLQATPLCIFDGHEPAVARFELSDGCACYPDTIQDLCPQHINRANPVGSMTLIAVWTLDRKPGGWIQGIPHG